MQVLTLRKDEFEIKKSEVQSLQQQLEWGLQEDAYHKERVAHYEHEADHLRGRVNNVREEAVNSKTWALSEEHAIANLRGDLQAALATGSSLNTNLSKKSGECETLKHQLRMSLLQHGTSAIASSSDASVAEQRPKRRLEMECADPRLRHFMETQHTLDEGELFGQS